MKEKIAVAILNWNGKALLEKYLPGVIEDLEHGKFHEFAHLFRADSTCPSCPLMRARWNAGLANKPQQVNRRDFIHPICQRNPRIFGANKAYETFRLSTRE